MGQTEVEERIEAHVNLFTHEGCTNDDVVIWSVLRVVAVASRGTHGKLKIGK